MHNLCCEEERGPALPQLRPLPSLRNANPTIECYSGSTTANKPVNQRTPALEYRTLVFKPWSGITTKNECEYNTVKEENQPEERIREEEGEDDDK